MRYRKSINICKGVKLNISKSGISTTFGIPGLSINTGRNGTYLNTGIPGTGFYDRKKIGGNNYGTSYSASSGTSAAALPLGDIDISYAKDGTITFLQDGCAITDASLIRKIKATPEFKAELQRMNEKRFSDYEDTIGSIIYIGKKATSVKPTEFYIDKLKNMHPQKYVVKEYTVPQPTKDDICKELEAQAKSEISTVLFWKKKALVNDFVNSRKDKAYSRAYNKWVLERNNFIRAQEVREESENKKFLKTFNSEKAQLRSLLSNDEDFIEKVINNWISSVEFPFEFNIQYKQLGKSLYVDLDLPEIEDMLTVKPQQMANGTVKMKNKTLKEIKTDYAECVFGLAQFFASYLFNIAVAADEVIISGYTQRRNKSGILCDDYIYSVKFTRDEFISLSYEESAKDNCMKFENRCNILSSGIFKVIEPF